MSKIFIEQNSLEAKVKVLVPMFRSLQVSKCEKCGNVVIEINKSTIQRIPIIGVAFFYIQPLIRKGIGEIDQRCICCR